MLYLIRFFYSALLLILVPMLFPQFNPGNRFVILMDAGIIAFLTWSLRWMIDERLTVGWRSLTGACGIVAGLLIAGRIFPGLRLTTSGFLGFYFGAVVMEWMLPGRLEQEVAEKAG